MKQKPKKPLNKNGKNIISNKGVKASASNGSESTTVLHVEGLAKHYDKNVILSDISFTAKKGDIFSILGSSGAGKSTLLRSLNFLEYPTAGSISLHGLKIDIGLGGENSVSGEEETIIRLFRRKMAMVFQQFNLWSHYTALENVMLAPVHVLGRPAEEAREEAVALLAKVGMEKHVAKYPSTLSGGEKQRVAIARALAMQPDVLLFDEPTSALDPELVGEVLLVIKELAKEKMTMLIVSHEMEFSRSVSNKTIFLHAGRIEEIGETSKMFAGSKNKRFSNFLKAGNFD